MPKVRFREEICQTKRACLIFRQAHITNLKENND